MKGKRGFSFLLLLVFIMVGCISLAGAANVPKEAKIHNQLGNEYCDKGEFEKGVEEYEKAVDIYPYYSDGLYNLCMTCYLDLKDYRKAVHYMKLFLEVEGNTSDAKQVRKWMEDAEKKLAAIEKEKTQPPQKKREPLEIASKEKEKKKEKIAPPPKSVKKVEPSVPKTSPPPSLAKITRSPVPKAAEIVPLPKERVPAFVSPEEKARKYKEKGNDYNRLGKSEEAVEQYLKALEIYPKYTDALYNVAKTYDFDLNDYANAVRYYKEFLNYESPSSRDAAQVKIWLGRVEKAYKEQKAEAKIKPVVTPKKEVASKPVIIPTKKEVASKPVIIPTKKEVASKPVIIAKKEVASKPEIEKAVKRKIAVGEEKLAGFITKGLLPATGAEGKKPAEIKKVAAQERSQPVQPKVSVSTPPPAPAEKETVVASIPEKVKVSPPPSERVPDNRQIVIETVIPRDLMGTKYVSIGMQRMQQEIIEFLAARKVKSPQKLAELYSSKIQSDILPTGDKVSYFRLEGKELSDLPYVSILTQQEKRDLEREKWELIRTRKSPARLREVLTVLRNGYKIER